MHTCERLRASRVAPCACCTRAVVYAALPPRRGVRARLARRQVRMHAHAQLLDVSMAPCVHVPGRDPRQAQVLVAGVRMVTGVTSRSSCAPSLLRGDATKHSLRVARCARAGAEYLRAAPSPPRCREARFACHQVRRRTCEQLRACGHTPEQLPERNLCTYTGSAVRCLVSTAMMPSLARTTSAVCSLPGAHAHTRSVVCLCWRRGVMLTCTRAGVCWASSTRGMRAARTSQRRSQAGLARRRVRGGVHARRSCRARLLLHDNAANMTHRPPDGQLRAARMVTCVHTQEQLWT